MQGFQWDKKSSKKKKSWGEKTNLCDTKLRDSLTLGGGELVGEEDSTGIVKKTGAALKGQGGWSSSCRHRTRKRFSPREDGTKQGQKRGGEGRKKRKVAGGEKKMKALAGNDAQVLTRPRWGRWGEVNKKTKKKGLNLERKSSHAGDTAPN